MATTPKKETDKKADDTKSSPKKKAAGAAAKRPANEKSSSEKVDADGKATKKPPVKKSTEKDDKYTNPDLRETIKEEIKAGEKGGKAGQWSARKAQLLSHEYEKQGGGYKDDTKTEPQEHLSQWTDQDWQTSDGKPADREGGTTRYLPKEAWDKLSDEEKKATNVKKVKGSKKGEQNVPNTEKAKKARKES